jgi:hypothetical protein
MPAAPSAAASASAVRPALSTAATSAPLFTSSCTSGIDFTRTAACSAVSPFFALRAPAKPGARCSSAVAAAASLFSSIRKKLPACASDTGEPRDAGSSRPEPGGLEGLLRGLLPPEEGLAGAFGGGDGGGAGRALRGASEWGGEGGGGAGVFGESGCNHAGAKGGGGAQKRT